MQEKANVEPQTSERCISEEFVTVDNGQEKNEKLLS